MQNKQEREELDPNKTEAEAGSVHKPGTGAGAGVPAACLSLCIIIML